MSMQQLSLVFGFRLTAIPLHLGYIWPKSWGRFSVTYDFVVPQAWLSMHRGQLHCLLISRHSHQLCQI